MPLLATSAEVDQTAPLQLLNTEGELVRTAANEPYLPLVEALGDTELREFHRQMALMRRLDIEAGNLQRQGQLALWVPSLGQEAAQVGSAYGARPQDTVFPSYREHVVARIRGVDLIDIIRMLRGVTHGGWDPQTHQNFQLYTLVIGSQALHATGYAMGIGLDGGGAGTGTGDPERDEAVVVYFGDGSTSQGDVNEAYVFAASFEAPILFFLQNNHWAISVPVARQSRTPLFQRAAGFGIPSVQLDGNDVLASYAASRLLLDEARASGGPRFIEALTYRMGAHTTSDDPSKYRDPAEFEAWGRRDPIDRFAAFLRGRGESESFFTELATEAEDAAADLRARTLALPDPGPDSMFAHVYSEPHPLMQEQAEWLERYEASLEDEA